MDRRNSNIKLKLGTINICGLSNRSRMVINKFTDSEKIDVLAVQETGTSNIDNLELNNMSVISDTNDAANKGAALYVDNRHSITKIVVISKMSKTWIPAGVLLLLTKRGLS